MLNSSHSCADPSVTVLQILRTAVQWNERRGDSTAERATGQGIHLRALRRWAGHDPCAGAVRWPNGWAALLPRAARVAFL